MIPVQYVIPGSLEINLSILICAINERAGMLAELLGSLEEQIKNVEGVQVIVSLDERGQNSTGAKRNALVNAAQGKYICFVDDDDEVFNNYVYQIVKALEGNPDVVSINGTMSENGKPHATWEISRHHQNFTSRKAGKIHYWRYCNHLSPVRKEIAMQCPFPEIFWEEDSAYSKALYNSKLIRIESKVLPPIYHYRYKKKI